MAKIENQVLFIDIKNVKKVSEKLVTVKTYVKVGEYQGKKQYQNFELKFAKGNIEKLRPMFEQTTNPQVTVNGNIEFSPFGINIWVDDIKLYVKEEKPAKTIDESELPF